MRSTRSSMHDSGFMREVGKNTIVSPNTVSRRSYRVTCGGLM
jgi:hypothetical protein